MCSNKPRRIGHYANILSRAPVPKATLVRFVMLASTRKRPWYANIGCAGYAKRESNASFFTRMIWPRCLFACIGNSMGIARMSIAHTSTRNPKTGPSAISTIVAFVDTGPTVDIGMSFVKHVHGT